MNILSIMLYIDCAIMAKMAGPEYSLSNFLMFPVPNISGDAILYLKFVNKGKKPWLLLCLIRYFVLLLYTASQLQPNRLGYRGLLRFRLQSPFAVLLLHQVVLL